MIPSGLTFATARKLARLAGCPGDSCPLCLGTGVIVLPKGWQSCPGPPRVTTPRS